jgi:hypothetical protein
VLKSLLRYLTTQYGIDWVHHQGAMQDIQVSSECVWRTTQADWWEWRGGSTIVFWSWHTIQQVALQDGRLPFFCHQPSRNYKAQIMD